MGILKSLFNNPINKFERSLFDNDPLNKMLFGGSAAEKILDIGQPGGQAPAAAEVAPPQAVDTLMTPTAMPTADSDAQRAARRKSLADQAKRRGRQSTILTGNDDSLGATG